MLAPTGGGGPGGAGAGLVEAARRVAEELLWPAAPEVDGAERVPAGHLRALAGAGLFGLAGPGAAGRDDARLVYEALAGACGATFFVWVQHHAPVRLLAATANGGLRDRWLAALLAGDVLGGVAFAHLRRPGPPAVVAEPAAGGGWVLSGEAPWATSWGMAGLFAVAARSRDRVVFAAVPAGERAGLSASPPLPLAVMHASSTVRLLLDRVAVPAGDVLDDLSFADWSARDRVVTAQPNPAAFGVAARCLRLLEEAGSPAAAPLGEEWDECRRRS